jgi:hypothetical protein
MKKYYLFLAFLLPGMLVSGQQVGIGTVTPNASAQLDITSNTSGLLIPRMNTAERTAIPVDLTTDGLLVYDTDTKSFFYHNSTDWVEISTGLAGTNYWTPGSNNISNNNPGNVGIGISGSGISEKFQVNASMKVGNNVWTTGNDRLIKFGDGSFVTIGEAGQDDRMVLTGRNFIFTPSSTYPGYLGINTVTPTSPLSFGNIIGEKINFWNTDATHNYGIGVQGGLLQIHSNDATADIAFGNGISSAGTAFNETVRFTGAGRVGIGTNAPGSMVEIKALSGQADLELNAQPSGNNALLKLNKSNSTNSAAIRFKNAGTVTWDIGTLNDDHFKIKYIPNNINILEVDNVTRNIGIFTNDFTEAVNISGNVAAYGAFISKFVNAGFQFQDRTNNSYGGWNWYADNGKANLFRYGTGNVLTIDQVGKLGIGITTPGNPLSFPAATGKKISLYPGVTGEAGVGVFSNELRLYSDNGSADMTFGYDSYAGGFTENLRMKANGFVGIHNSNPLAPVSLDNNVGNKIALWGDANTPHYGIGIQGGLMQLYTNVSGADIVFGFGKSDAMTENVRMKGNGKVGIGTNNPGEKLEIRTGDGEAGWKHSWGASAITSYAGSLLSPAKIICSGAAFQISQGNNDGIFLTTAGKVLIGPTPNLFGATGYLLNVGGKVIAEEVMVQVKANWPDYVFEKEYRLPSLQSVKKYIDENRHLPGIPAAFDIEKNGLELGDMQKKMMEKIEQLTLYVVDLQNQINQLKSKTDEKQ